MRMIDAFRMDSLCSSRHVRCTHFAGARTQVADSLQSEMKKRDLVPPAGFALSRQTLVGQCTAFLGQVYIVAWIDSGPMMHVHVQPILSALASKLGGGDPDMKTIFQVDAATVDRCLGTLLGGSVSRPAAILSCAYQGRVSGTGGDDSAAAAVTYLQSMDVADDLPRAHKLEPNVWPEVADFLRRGPEPRVDDSRFLSAYLYLIFHKAHGDLARMPPGLMSLLAGNLQMTVSACLCL